VPKISSEIKERIKALSKKELSDIVIKLAAKKENFDFLLVTYLDRESGEKDLFEQAKNDIDLLCTKRYKGFSEQLRLANMLGACVKRINEFSKVSKKKNLEADLIVYVLDIPFSYPVSMLGTCFTAYDYKVGLLLKRLLTLVTKKLHEDYRIEYEVTINDRLNILHQHSNHVDTIYALPKSI
jgi:hypothetical protein